MALVVREQVPLRKLTTLQTGGCARYVTTVTTVDELKAAVVFAQQKQLPFFVIGGGSNVLAADAGYAGVIILMRMMGREYELSDTTDAVTATFGAGESLDAVITDTVSRGYSGLENLSHIPGTVGATPVQNVGAYGVEVADCITAVTVYDTQTKSVRQFSNQDCQFQYRDSVFKRPASRHLIITAVTFRLSTTPQLKIHYGDLKNIFGVTTPTPQDIRTALITIRNKKFPDWTTVGTAGSFFKNPLVTTEVADTLVARYPDVPVYPARDGMVKVSLGYILDKVCQLKGYQLGPVRLYEEQALVLVADIGATTHDIEIFVDTICKIVFAKTNLQIEREVTKVV